MHPLIIAIRLMPLDCYRKNTAIGIHLREPDTDDLLNSMESAIRDDFPTIFVYCNNRTPDSVNQWLERVVGTTAFHCTHGVVEKLRINKQRDRKPCDVVKLPTNRKLDKLDWHPTGNKKHKNWRLFTKNDVVVFAENRFRAKLIA